MVSTVEFMVRYKLELKRKSCGAIFELKKKNSMLAYGVVCCYVTRLNQIAALEYVSRTNQIVVF